MTELYTIDERGIEWRYVYGFEDYIVSELGEVCRPGRNIMDPKPDKSGYVRISLRKNMKQLTMTLQIIVCRAFHGDPPPNKPFALHKDDIKTNNVKDNLYWGSHQDNMNDLKRNNRVRRKNKLLEAS